MFERTTLLEIILHRDVIKKPKYSGSDTIHLNKAKTTWVDDKQTDQGIFYPEK
jgi:hypothetical protein